MSAAEHPARLRVGVIGPGRVGTVLARALALAGHSVAAVAAVSQASRERAASWLPDATVREPADVLAETDLVLLTVPDDELERLVDGLARTGARLSGKLLVHTSGSYGVSILRPAIRHGAIPLAIHPVMTFTGRQEDVDKLTSCRFGVTAPEELRPVAEALVVEMGGEPVFIAEQHRALYHAALAYGANYLVTLVTESARLLELAGVAEPGKMLGPLLEAALDNGLRLGIDGLTGPVVRGDARTVGGHIAQLQGSAPEALPSYLALARLTADWALAAGVLDPTDAEDLLDALAGREDTT